MFNMCVCTYSFLFFEGKLFLHHHAHYLSYQHDGIKSNNNTNKYTWSHRLELEEMTSIFYRKYQTQRHVIMILEPHWHSHFCSWERMRVSISNAFWENDIIFGSSYFYRCFISFSRCLAIIHAHFDGDGNLNGSIHFRKKRRTKNCNQWSVCKCHSMLHTLLFTCT